MPREHGRPKHGPNYYHYLVNRHHPTRPFLNAQLTPDSPSPPASPSVGLPPIAHVQKKTHGVHVLVEEEFPSTPPQVTVRPSVVPPVDIQSFQVTTTLDGGDLPVQSSEENGVVLL
jgi:hypothetical protein